MYLPFYIIPPQAVHFLYVEMSLHYLEILRSTNTAVAYINRVYNSIFSFRKKQLTICIVWITLCNRTYDGFLPRLRPAISARDAVNVRLGKYYGMYNLTMLAGQLLGRSLWVVLSGTYLH